MTEPITPIEPPWFTAKLDQVLQTAKLLNQDKDWDVIMMPLTEADEDTCDGCGRRVGQAQIHPGHAQRYYPRLEVMALVSFGVCPDCKEGFA